MKCLKMVGLLAVAAAALMAFAGGASAGNFTNPKNTVWTGELHATSGELTTHGVVTITCSSSTFTATINQHGADPITGKGTITTLTFSACGSNDVTVVNKGTLEVHTHPADSSGGTYGIVTSSGATINIQMTGLGITCGFQTNNTEIGTLTTSTHRQVTGEGQTTAQIHVDGVPIPRHSGSIFCGSSSEWTGTYEITTPDYLDYD